MGMNNGIEILNQTMIYETRSEGLSYIMSMLLVIGILLAIYYASYKRKILTTVYIILSCSLLFLMIYFGTDVSTGRYEYQAIISEDYSANNLFDQYDVIRQDGKIWVLQDKEK